MSFWDFSDTLSRRLLAWSSFSIGSGLGLSKVENEFLQGAGMQFATWGAIDALIALIGKRNTHKNRQLPQEEQQPKQEAEAIKLRNLLWFNTFLDVFYVLGGVWLWRNKGADSRKWRGHSVGIIIQGGFLFLFDLYHAFKVPR
ncbi:MAG: hypothetical protein KDE51_10290 [Anaerolineales bacterium]|nr:hypothetical protein [Anaerolineales bacterium]